MLAVVPLTILRSQERAKLFTFLMIGQTVLYHLLAIVLVLYFKSGVTGLLWSNLAASKCARMPASSEAWPPAFNEAGALSGT